MDSREIVLANTIQVDTMFQLLIQKEIFRRGIFGKIEGGAGGLSEGQTQGVGRLQNMFIDILQISILSLSVDQPIQTNDQIIKSLSD